MTKILKTLSFVFSIFLFYACQKSSILENPDVTLPEQKETAPVSPKSVALQKEGVALFGELIGQQKLDDLPQAFALLDEAAKEDPNNHLAYSTKGGLLLSLGRYTEAAEAFANAVKIRPQVGEYYVGRAVALQRTGDEGSAKASLRHAIAAFNLRLKKNPDDPSRVDRAMAAYLLGEQKTALDEFQAVLKLRPDDKAAAEMKKFIESNPADPWGFLGL